jgi:REP element-mobilizing transposase RayT
MPRTSRIDFPGALHHVIARGINRHPIFLDRTDRNLFLDRFSTLLSETGTRCFAWALMSNHFHLLLSTAAVHLSTVMQRLLTWHAITFNKRHDRCGHLFQNRFRSILCQEDAYLLELVRYIHLNPLGGGLVRNLSELIKYPYCGHGVLMGQLSNAWQDAGYVLRLFHNELPAARRRYGWFVKTSLSDGRSSHLVEGNLVCRSGYWSEVKTGDGPLPCRTGYERILGDDDFINHTLEGVDEMRECEYRLMPRKYDFKAVAARIAAWLGMKTEDVLAPNRGHRTVQARRLLCYLVTSELGVSQTRLGRDLGMTQAGVSKAARRGRELATREGYSLVAQS